VRVRFFVILALALTTVAMSSSSAYALVPRVAICGRVTFLDVVTPGGPIVTLGTQQPRHLVTGALPQLGQEVCIKGYDVGTQAAPGIAGFGVVPVASIGCANAVIGTSAFFEMPGEAGPLPNHATLVLPLSKPAGDGCVRIGIDAAGNPVAVVFPRAAGAPTASPTARPAASSLPSTSAIDDGAALALVVALLGVLGAIVSFVLRRRAIPS
jgi:hypothetical protein